MAFFDNMSKHFEKNFDRLDDKSLSAILSAQVQMRLVTGQVLFKKLDNPTALRNLVLRVLHQQNFESKYYSIILGQTFNLMTHEPHNPGKLRRDLPVRLDLHFWVECVRYIPRLSFPSEQEVNRLIQTLIKIDTELVELDF